MTTRCREPRWFRARRTPSCNVFTGVTGAISGERINYSCSDGWVIVGEPTVSTVWAVQEVRLARSSLDVQAVAQLHARTAWEKRPP
jgi:hypothetical protein